MSKLEHIHSFVTVVEENSFHGAANKMGVSSATISRQISALETELGAQLIKRTTRSLSLTDVGRRYYEAAKKLVQQFIETENVILDNQQEPTGTLRVTATRYFAENSILPHLAEFMALYPKLVIVLELADRLPDFSKENVDLMFAVSLEGPPELVRRKVTATRFLFAASKLYLAQNGTPNTPEDLLQHRYITSFARKDFVTFHNHPSLKVKPVLWLNDTHAIRQCAIAGLGIIKGHELSLSQAIASGQLVEVLKDYSEPEQPVYLYYQAHRYVEPKLRKFIDFFIEKTRASV